MNVKQLVVMMTSVVVGGSCDTGRTGISLEWRQLPQLPDPVGFAGAYAGMSNGRLLVGGGANFPAGTRPWSGGVKQWNDKVYAWEADADNGQWKEVGQLPRPMGYGVSLTWGDQVLVIGGADQHQHYREVYSMQYSDGRFTIDSLPPLPEPNANACGALVGDVIYIAGGLDAPQAQQAKHTFWSLDLSEPPATRQWVELESWPGEPRMLSVAGAMDGELYLISGVSLAVPVGDSLPRRTYLNDAYRYTPQLGWRKLSDLPHAVTAAPSPAYSLDNHALLVFGGDDGALVDQGSILKDHHPGFRTDILLYDVREDRWNIFGNLPTDQQPDPANDPNASTWAPVTAPAVVWDGQVVFPMGEVRPGVRTNRVLVAKPVVHE